MSQKKEQNSHISEEKLKDESDDRIKGEQINLATSSRHMSKAMFYTLLRSYGVLPLNLLMTWFISHNISSDLWGKYTYSIILINASTIFLVFIPPSLNNILLYKIPELMVNNEEGKAMGLIKFAFRMKLISSTIATIIYLIIGLIYIQDDDPNRILYGKLLIILSPTVILIQIRSISSTILKTKKIFNIMLIFPTIELFLLFLGYFFSFRYLEGQEPKVISMAYTYLITTLFTTALLFFYYKKEFKDMKYEKVKWNQIQDNLKFGLKLSIAASMNTINQQIGYGVLERWGNSSLITYYNIAQNMNYQANKAITVPMAPVLTDLEQTNQRKEMIKLFKKTIMLTSLILAFIGGLLYYFLRIYVLIAYTPEYLEIVDLIKNFMLMFYFQNLYEKFDALFTIIHKENKIVQLAIIKTIIFSAAYLFGFYFQGFSGFITFQIYGASIIALIYLIWLNNLIKPNKLSISNVFRHILSLGIIIIIINFVFDNLYVIFEISNINLWLLDLLAHRLNIGLATYNNIQTITETLFYMISFMILYLLYIVILKGFTKKDLDNLESFGFKIPFKKLIRYILRDEK